ncbi:MAG: hypothetical protein JRI23_00470, partial [Deltaproteobacteria bacterium]|nr:hypothetical protein [Deltaproteobacteria bacterium]MBW2529919.1 hypothetical protein [Deltaproteobacteria bacterium]
MTSDDSLRRRHPELTTDWAESAEATVSIEDLVTLSPTSVEAVLPAAGSDDGEPERGGFEPRTSLAELVRRSPDLFGAGGAEAPSSLEMLFYEVVDDDPEAWSSPPPRVAPTAGRALELTRTSGFPALQGPDADDDILRDAVPPSRSITPVSIDAPLSLEGDDQRRVAHGWRRRWTTPAYVAALAAAALGGAWLSQRTDPATNAGSGRTQADSGWSERDLAAAAVLPRS